MSATEEGMMVESTVPRLLREARASCDCVVEPLMRKDSALMDVNDRKSITRTVDEAPESHIVVIHGTDTAVETLEMLNQTTGKTVVMTGSFKPAGSAGSDAAFNLGGAMLASLILWPGAYLVIGGDIFYPNHVEKRRNPRRFVHLPAERRSK